ncbi:hypothetical protein ACFLVH_01435 [Chloroflexota bacterium]
MNKEKQWTTARFDGYCYQCESWILPGDKVYHRDSKFLCLNCGKEAIPRLTRLTKERWPVS